MTHPTVQHLTSQPTRPDALASTVPDLPTGRADRPDPRAVCVQWFARTVARLKVLAEGWTPEADRHYADELAPLLPQFSPGQGRELFRRYADAVQAVADMDSWDEPTLLAQHEDWPSERAIRAEIRDTELSALVRTHPAAPAWSAETCADPVYMAERIQQLTEENRELRTDLARARRRLSECMAANDSLHAMVQALTDADAPAPYVPAVAVIHGGLDAI